MTGLLGLAASAVDGVGDGAAPGRNGGQEQVEAADEVAVALFDLLGAWFADVGGEVADELPLVAVAVLVEDSHVIRVATATRN